MTDLDQAREWANRTLNDDPFPPHEGVAARLIQSLPDQLVDVEKLKVIIADMDHCLKMESTTDFSRGIDNATTSWRDALKALITPKLPTLADMTPEERKACQWMQCKVAYSDEIHVVARTGLKLSALWREDGYELQRNNDHITPLPDLQKLKWPGSEVVEPPALQEDERIESWHEIASHKFFSDCYRDGVLIDHMIKKLDEVVDAEIVDEPETVDAPPAEKAALPKPEDVPPNEPWLIEVADEKSIGTRFAGDSFAPWSVASLDGSFAGDDSDSDVTLIHKLVPETHALPKGMRLADHEEYGRVVVAPHANTHGEEYFYRTNEDNPWGASHAYRPTGEFTFLGGDQHA